MKKKLSLSSQTVRVLSADALSGVVGGLSADPVRCHHQSEPLRCVTQKNPLIVYVPPFGRLHDA